MLQNKINIKKETAKKNEIKKPIPLTNKTTTEGQLCIQKNTRHLNIWTIKINKKQFSKQIL